MCVCIQDWLQGPYVYALYDSYGYGSEDIAILFIVGFMTSMVCMCARARATLANLEH